MKISDYIDLLNDMRMYRKHGHTSPHKAVMMLAVIDLIASGEIEGNRIYYDPELLEHFRRYFDLVKTGEDSFSPINPYFYLRSEDFWHHKAIDGKEEVCRVISNPGGSEKLRSVVEYAYVDDELYALLCDRQNRAEVRKAIISRYFSEHYEELMRLIIEEDQAADYQHVLQTRVRGKVAEASDIPESVRDLAFARVVKRAYQHQCAACGLRLNFEGVSLVDAAHIIPFSESHDDDPRNGMALCKNHHWAMDREMIFPCSDNRWHILSDIDSRIDSHRALVDLDGKNILLPAQKKYYPKPESLIWRERLKGVAERYEY